jgi:hypothetical protein
MPAQYILLAMPILAVMAFAPFSSGQHPRSVEVRSSANDESAPRQRFGVHGSCTSIELPGSLFSTRMHESSEKAVMSRWNFREAGPPSCALTFPHTFPSPRLYRDPRFCEIIAQMGRSDWLRDH